MAPNAVEDANVIKASVIPEMTEVELLTQVADLEGEKFKPKTIAFIALGSRGDVQVRILLCFKDPIRMYKTAMPIVDL